jgi:hemerythrin-like domain-containing protein
MDADKPPGAMTREMQMVHTGFRREFGLMPALVRGVAEGDKPRAEIVVDHVELLSLVLHHHHHAEDEHIWPRLLERCPEEIAPIVHTMEDHHERIANVLTELTAALAAWRGTADAERGETLAAVLDRLVSALFEHLEAEEERVLPLIEEHITAVEWDGMVAEGAAELPQDKLPLLFGMNMYEGDPRAVRDALDNIPPEVRPIITEMAPKAFAAYAEQLYGTPTPPRHGALV